MIRQKKLQNKKKVLFVLEEIYVFFKAISTVKCQWTNN